MPNPEPRPQTSHLKRGGNQGNTGGRPRETAKTRAVRRICQRLVDDPVYRKTIREKLRDCTLHPSVQVLLWYYAYGKPKETIEATQVTPVRIEHVYATPNPVVGEAEGCPICSRDRLEPPDLGCPAGWHQGLVS